jgi:hypothetical protein|nr:MAG TPA: hypothetical protein [Myoviridae sp. ctTS62]
MSGIYNIVSGIISERDKQIEDAILELVEQGSKPEDLTLEYCALTQIHIVRDTVKGSSKVISTPNPGL